ncbi:hypothetical protein GCM10022202_15360 [Microbacterium marinilacus]|uniref:Oligosaccharide repeat unit polymerase n=1 Tax=Microbacterium marinilacus TaxID=415209 RepID=A0ABP7BED8_9MICO
MPAALVPTALGLLCIAFAAFAVGYAAGGMRPLVAPVAALLRMVGSSRSQALRSPAALCGVFGLGVVADLLTALLAGRFGYLGNATLATADTAQWFAQPLVIASAMKTLAIFGLAIHAFSRRPRGQAVLWSVVSIAVVMGLISGLKESFVTVVLAVAIGYIVAGRKLSLSWLGAALAAFVLVVTPFVTELRTDVRQGTQTVSLSDSVQHGWSQLFSSDGYVANSDPLVNIVQVAARVRAVDNLALIIEKTPDQVAYRSAGELISAPVVGLIPRSIWPDKPVRLTGYDFYKTYYGGEGQSSSAVTLQGSLYMYGGPMVVVLGMAVVGTFLRALDDGLQARRNRHGALVVAVLALIVTKQELDVASFLAGVPVLALTCVAGLLLLFKPSSRASNE